MDRGTSPSEVRVLCHDNRRSFVALSVPVVGQQTAELAPGAEVAPVVLLPTC